MASLLSRWPLKTLVYWLSPLLDRFARWWLATKREVLPGFADATPSVVGDVLKRGSPVDKERLFAFLTEWYSLHPGELERFVAAVIPQTNMDGRRRLYAAAEKAAATCDEQGQAFARDFAAATDATNEALARSLAEPLTRDLSGKRLERLLEEALKVAPPALKQRLYAWVEDRSAGDEHAVAYAERVFDWVRRSIEKHKGPLRGLRILELGPGHMLVTGILFYVHGARSYTAIDFFPIAGKDSSIYERLRRHIADRPQLWPVPAEGHAEALRRFDEVVKLTGPEVSLDESKVTCRYPVDAAKLPFADGSFDVIFSIASFEHFSDPVAAVRECTRVMAPGGVALHQIDLRDHRDFTKPLDFLRYEEDEWKKLHKDLFCFTNRFRKSDFERAFSESGLEVNGADVTTRVTVDAALRAQLHPRFRERPIEDLEAVSVFFTLQKPAGVGA